MKKQDRYRENRLKKHEIPVKNSRLGKYKFVIFLASNILDNELQQKFGRFIF